MSSNPAASSSTSYRTPTVEDPDEDDLDDLDGKTFDLLQGKPLNLETKMYWPLSMHLNLQHRPPFHRPNRHPQSRR